MSEHPDFELELHAFVDGELPPERHAAVAAAVDRDPELQRQVRELRELNASLARLAGPLLAMPMPDHLTRAALRDPADDPLSLDRARRRAQARATIRGPRLARWIGTAAMATAASVAIGIVVSRDPTHRHAVSEAVADPLVADALAARDGKQDPIRQVSFTADTDAGARDRFVSEALGNTIRAPDLRHAGYTLVEADLYGGAGGRAIQLRYVDHDRHLFTVYVHPGGGPDRFSLLQLRSIKVCIWQNEDMGTVMSAALPTPELFRLSSMTYSALAL